MCAVVHRECVCVCVGYETACVLGALTLTVMVMVMPYASLQSVNCVDRRTQQHALAAIECVRKFSSTSSSLLQLRGDRVSVRAYFKHACVRACVCAFVRVFV